MEQSEPPSAAFVAGDSEFEGGLSAGVAEDSGTGEEAAAQGAEFGAVRLAKPTLQPDAKIVGRNGEMAGRFRGPERTAAQARQAKLGPEFLDPFSISARPL
jgi:hypothetical protein